MPTRYRNVRRAALTLLGACIVTTAFVACDGGRSYQVSSPTETLAITISAGASATPASPTQTLRTPSPAPSITPDALASATPTREPGVISYAFEPSVGQADRTLIVRGIDYAADYLQDAAGLPPVDCTVFGANTQAGLAVALLQSGVSIPVTPNVLLQRLRSTSAETLPGAIFIAITSEGWQNSSDLHRFRIPAHEYFHAVQLDLMGQELTARMLTTPITEERPEGPSWLFEGAAEYFSWKALENAELADLDAYLRDNPVDAGADLRDVETFLEYASGEPHSLVLPLSAVRLLLDDGGPEPLIDFWQRLGDGEEWRVAFDAAFGRPVEVFYQEFDHWVANQ